MDSQITFGRSCGFRVCPTRAAADLVSDLTACNLSTSLSIESSKCLSGNDGSTQEQIMGRKRLYIPHRNSGSSTVMFGMFLPSP